MNRSEFKPGEKFAAADRAARVRLRGGFTILEMLVVVALLAIVAGITLPRLTGNEYRRARLAAEDTADLLTLFAHREGMGAQNIALGYDPETGTIMLLERMGDPADPYNLPRWEFDRFIDPVQLPPGLEVTDARVAGRSLRDPDWLIPVIPGIERPMIELFLEGSGIACRIVLPGHAETATVVYPNDRNTSLLLPHELDDREVW